MRGWLGRGGYMIALTAIVGVVASLGQKKYAEDKGFTKQVEINGFDFTPWAAPFVFDLAVAALLHGGLNAARNRLSPWLWWTGAGVVAALSIYTNAQHVGKEITAPASAGLFIIWGLYLFDEYKLIVRRRGIEDASAAEFRSDDVLFNVDKKLADRAWIIARSGSIVAGHAYRHRLGETDLTLRDVTIRAARIYLDVLADLLDTLMDPTAAALAGDTSKPNGDRTKARKIRWWQTRRRRNAHRIARMAAGDQVDVYLGQPVLERSGVTIPRVSYVMPAAGPTLGAAEALRLANTAPQQALQAAPPVAEPQQALEAAPPVVRPRPVVPARPARRAIAKAPEPAEVVDQDDEVVVVDVAEVVRAGAPLGLAGVNWLPLEEIVRDLPEGTDPLPAIDPDLKCKCGPTPDKWCKWTLLDHVERRGKQIRPILEKRPEWSTGERVGKRQVKQYIGASSDVQQLVGWLFDQLRDLADQQRQVADGSGPVLVAELEAAPAAEDKPEQ
jgi:hypothetical protein